jgi:ADP-ribose pyrophosphatase YjhB (NUDIX family)
MNRASAVCVVIVRRGQVLGLVRRDGGIGLPGGKVDGEESERDAAARELREETGLNVSPFALREIHRSVEQSSGRDVATYWADDPGGDPRPSPEGCPLWMGWDALVTGGPCSGGGFQAYNAAVRRAVIDRIPDQWVREYGSGSLRRAIEEGLRWHEMYLEERAAFEFGYGFEPIKASRVTLGEALASGDDHATTETCWWARALRWRADRGGFGLTSDNLGKPSPQEHRYTVTYAHVSGEDEREGIAIRLDVTPHPHWLGGDRILLAFTTARDGTTVNPC